MRYELPDSAEPCCGPWPPPARDPPGAGRRARTVQATMSTVIAELTRLDSSLNRDPRAAPPTQRRRLLLAATAGHVLGVDVGARGCGSARTTSTAAARIRRAAVSQRRTTSRRLRPGRHHLVAKVREDRRHRRALRDVVVATPTVPSHTSATACSSTASRVCRPLWDCPTTSGHRREQRQLRGDREHRTGAAATSRCSPTCRSGSRSVPAW